MSRYFTISATLGDQYRECEKHENDKAGVYPFASFYAASLNLDWRCFFYF